MARTESPRSPQPWLRQLEYHPSRSWGQGWTSPAINVGPAERLASNLGGGLLLLAGLSQRGRAGWTLAGVGAALLYRGLTGHCALYSAVGTNTARAEPPRARALRSAPSQPAGPQLKPHPASARNRRPARTGGPWSPRDLIDRMSTYDPARLVARGPMRPEGGHGPDESGPPADDAAEQTRRQQEAAASRNTSDRSRDDQQTRIGRGHQTHG